MAESTDLLEAMLGEAFSIQITTHQAKRLEVAVTKSRLPGLSCLLHSDPAIAAILDDIYSQIEERARALIKLAEFLEGRVEFLEGSDGGR